MGDITALAELWPPDPARARLRYGVGVAGLLGGDLFASEDRHGTWKTILTRLCARGDLYAGKVLAAGALAVGLTLLLAVSSVLAGVALVGAHSLPDLSGVPTSPGRLLGLTALSWLTCLLPMPAYTSVAILVSVATRNGIVGVLGPLLVALVTQLLDLIGRGVGMHLLLIGSAFDGWHGLFATHAFYGPLAISSVVSVVWIAACPTAGWMILRRRDILTSARPGLARSRPHRGDRRRRSRRARPALRRRAHGRHRPPHERGDRGRAQQPVGPARHLPEQAALGARADARGDQIVELSQHERREQQWRLSGGKDRGGPLMGALTRVDRGEQPARVKEQAPIPGRVERPSSLRGW